MMPRYGYVAPFYTQAKQIAFVHVLALVHINPAEMHRQRVQAQAVIDAERHFYEAEYANVHRGVYWLSQRATDAYEAAREKVRRLLNARETREIVFVRGATEAINLVAQSYGRTFRSAGDEVLITHMEHHANIVPWQMLRDEKGCKLRVIPCNDAGELVIEEYEKLLNARTKFAAFTHVSNALGSVNPVKQMIATAHRHGVPVLVDGAQAIPHLPIDVQDLDCDFYAFTGHKVYGPTGIGALYAKHEHLVAMRPFNGGGEMIQEVTKDLVTYADPPARFEAGTPPIIESVGLAAAIDYLSSFDRAAIAAHEHDLLAYAREAVRQFNWLKVIGDAPGKGAILSFTVDGAHAHDVAQILDKYGVAVRAGTHCAEPLMRRFGVTSSARASFALYNTLREADAFVDALTKTQAFFA
jgi:cysteine desulfurase/selenocysteine lyase